MSRHRFRPAPRSAGPCPGWCEIDHALDLDIEDGIRLHARKVTADVEVVACDDLEAGTRTATEVVVRAASFATQAHAQRLALAILDAADSLGGAP